MPDPSIRSLRRFPDGSEAQTKVFSGRSNAGGLPAEGLENVRRGKGDKRNRDVYFAEDRPGATRNRGRAAVHGRHSRQGRRFEPGALRNHRHKPLRNAVRSPKTGELTSRTSNPPSAVLGG